MRPTPTAKATRRVVVFDDNRTSIIKAVVALHRRPSGGSDWRSSHW